LVLLVEVAARGESTQIDSDVLCEHHDILLPGSPQEEALADLAQVADRNTFLDQTPQNLRNSLHRNGFLYLGRQIGKLGRGPLEELMRLLDSNKCVRVTPDHP